MLYKVVSFPCPFYLAALNLESNRNFVVILDLRLSYENDSLVPAE